MGLFDDHFLTAQTSEFIPKLPPLKSLTVEDTFEVRYTVPTRKFLTDAELAAISPGAVFVFDSESFVNYALICFKHVDSGKYLAFEYPFNVGKLQWVMQRFLIIGFNSRTYDIPMVTLAIAGFPPRDLNLASGRIIYGKMFPYQIEQSYKVQMIQCNHIDLKDVAPLYYDSLKLYAGRLHCRRMQELPIAPDATLTSEQRSLIRDYCLNDTDLTELVFECLKPQLELRYSLSNTYQIDLRSKSDAQIAEAVIGAELHRLTKRKPERQMSPPQWFYYLPPPTLAFHSEVFNDLTRLICNTPFQLDEEGKIKIPDALKKKTVDFEGNRYRIGIGGLHSSEEHQRTATEHGMLLFDRDVASYYPSIILRYEFYPRHLGKAFLEVYRNLVRKRLEAKEAAQKVTSDALKITINGTFGKLGSRYSILYSPELLIQVTISGQLFLLQLIDMLYTWGDGYIHVKSANTDGLLISCHCEHVGRMREIVAYWEQHTGFTTEETAYKAVYSRDVNNYIGVKADGSGIKVKGTYSERGSSGDSPLSRNPEAFVCGDAVKQYLTSGVPVEQTIRECRDIRRFVFVRNVKGGAVKSGIYLGKTVRWYYSTQMHGDIRYQISGNKVPNTDCGRPLMELCDALPDDLDIERYIGAAESILYDIGEKAEKPLEYNDKFRKNYGCFEGLI